MNRLGHICLIGQYGAHALVSDEQFFKGPTEPAQVYSIWFTLKMIDKIAASGVSISHQPSCVRKLA